MAGGGVGWSGAGEEVASMADLLGAAVVTSYGRADAVPSDHPKFLGHLGRLGAAEAIEAVRHSDVILLYLRREHNVFQTSYVPSF